MIQNHNEKVLRELQSETRTVWRDLIGPPTRVALLDFPRHNNAGDTLIWQGELNHLAALGHEVVYVSDIGRLNFSLLRQRLGSDGVVLLHGGGNFGDLWPLFQEERERVALEMSGNRIVVLPQSVYFEVEGRAALTNEIFSKHGGVSVMARDHLSLEFARRLLPDVPVTFSHDAALGNEPIAATGRPEADVLVLQRLDKESTPMLDSVDSSWPRADWRLNRIQNARWMLNRVPGAIYSRVPHGLQKALEGAVASTYHLYVDLNMTAATAILSRGRIIVTDRLHAHVWAILMGKGSIVVENSYGKIGPIHEATLHRFANATFVRDQAELAGAIRSPASLPSPG